MGVEENTVQISQKRKKEKQDNLLEELLREKAAVLSRAGTAVDDIIRHLKRVDREIEKKISILKNDDGPGRSREIAKKKKSIREEINLEIDQFNAIRQKAQLQYYYLIVTREALGLRRHEMVQEIYRIPGKKEKIR